VERFIGLLGVMLILGIAFLISNNRKAIPYPLIIKGLGLQLGLAIFILKVPVGQQMFAWIARLIEKVLQFSDAGANFVFGPLVNQLILTKSFGAGNDFIFFFKVIPTIIFVSVLVNMAYHIGLMQRIVAGVARVMHFVMGVSGSEAMSNAASAFVGQVEAQIMIKPYLAGMTRSELLASMAGSMACVAGGVMATYISLGIPAAYLLTASLMAAPGALVISKIVYPETETSQTQGVVKLTVGKTAVNLIDAISHGASDGLRVGLNVVAMLIGFIALISFFDYILGKAGGWVSLPELSLKYLLGWIFAGFAWCMGVPGQDIRQAGSLMGTKIVVNEFVAYLDMIKIIKTLQPKTVVVVSFALCGFANFASIAIQVGGIGQLVPERRKDLAQLGIRALVCGTLASYLSATLAGMLV
jgi:concentrative nucleoside transporter, CNT family